MIRLYSTHLSEGESICRSDTLVEAGAFMRISVSNLCEGLKSH